MREYDEMRKILTDISDIRDRIAMRKDTPQNAAIITMLNIVETICKAICKQMEE